MNPSWPKLSYLSAPAWRHQTPLAQAHIGTSENWTPQKIRFCIIVYHHFAY